jgi:hypothetical protein
MNLFNYGNPTEEELRVGVKPSEFIKNQKYIVLSTNEAAYYNYHKDYKLGSIVNWSFLVNDRLKKLKNKNYINIA